MSNPSGTQTGRISSKGPRPIYQIAQAIADNWAACYSDKPKKPNFYIWAMPYLNAMHHLSTPATRYGMEYGDMIVVRFLSAVVSWRGPFAAGVKAELNEHLDHFNNRKES